MGDAPIPGETTITIDPLTGDEVVQTSQRHEYDPATARQALQLIGQHKAVQAFTVTVEHSHTPRLEARVAARSKLVEGRAGAMDAGPVLGGPGRSNQVVATVPPGMAELGTGAHLDAPATGRLKKVPSSGGQTKRARATQGTARESAGATAK